MSDRDWLDSLKVGDTVFMSRDYGACHVPVRVVRFTKTRLFVSVGKNITGEVIEVAFRRDNGHNVGGNVWHVQHIAQDEPRRWEAYKLSIAKDKCTKLRGKIGTPDTLAECEAMILALTPFVKEKIGGERV